MTRQPLILMPGGSKTVGEPPFMLAVSVFEAMREAVGR